MSSGNHTVDQAIAGAAQLLQNSWWNPATARKVQQENQLVPDAAQLQFRIKLLEDRIEVLERMLRVGSR